MVHTQLTCAFKMHGTEFSLKVTEERLLNPHV